MLRQPPPGPIPRFPNLLMRFRRNPLLFLTQAAYEYGDVVRLKFGPRELILLNHPDDIYAMLVTNQKILAKSVVLQRSKRLLGNGLLTSEGEQHMRQRRLVQPAFHRKRIAGYAEVMVSYAAEMREQWQPNHVFDVHAEMMRLTLRIVAKTLFDADVERDAQAVGEALEHLLNRFNVMILPFAELIERLPLASNRRVQASIQYLDQLMFRVIEERRHDQRDHGDLLSMLLLAQDTEGDGTGMDNQQVRDEAITLFLAGHETTANALSWTWYLLSQHPAIAERWYRELDEVLAGRIPTMDDVQHLSYTRMILAESIRMYPPAWIIGREALADYHVGDYVFPAGIGLTVSPFVVHHDERWFPNAYQFNPERWTAEQIAQRPKWSYIPFGGGSRICIGEQFAWMEGILLLATIGQRWRLKLVPGHPVALQPVITLRPRHGIKMVAIAR